MNTPNNAAALERLPQPKYLAKLSRDGEWAELVPATDWTAEMWAYGTEPVYSAEQMREALATLRATLAQPDAITVRIAHKGPSDFPNHQCPAESSAVWNACCMEHERVLAGEVPMLTTTALTSQPSGEAVGYVTPAAIEALNKCRNDNHNGTVDLWMRQFEFATIPLYTHPSADAPGVAVDEARLAEAEARWRDEGDAFIDARDLLCEVAEWISNWEPNFADDPEWQLVADRIEAITNRSAALAPKPEGGHG